jgi:uncharacterized protein
MTLALDYADLDAPHAADSGPCLGHPDPLEGAIREACARIAPVWPLSSFVAVNPFLGFADTPFDQAAKTLARLTGARMVMPRAFYRDAVQTGRITLQDLRNATHPRSAIGLTPRAVLDALERPAQGSAKPDRIATVAEVLDRLSDGDRQVSRTTSRSRRS